jgi:hypothetical protein
MAKTTKVRTTFTPGKVIKVDERELLDLERQGLIYSRETAEGATVRKGEHAWRDDKPIEQESGVVTDTTPAELADKRKAAK